MIVACEDRNTSARLPIPDPNGLVITSTHYPRVLLMELHRTDIIQMPQKGEQASSQLVIPHFNLVVIP